MKNTSNYAPFRKGLSHGYKSSDNGTNKFWVKLIQGGQWTEKHEFQAENEDKAASIALSLCSLEKPESSEWEFIHECSRHRGYEIKVSGCIIQLFHILRDS